MTHGVDDQVRTLTPDEWLPGIEQALAEGFVFLDHLACIDEIGRSDEFRLLLRLVDFGATPPRGLQLHVRVPREAPMLPTATALLPGLAWHEREAHDFFGVVFDGGDPSPLLNHPPAGQEAPRTLRKDAVLAARTVAPWPGAKEPGEAVAAPSRRKMAPPGVPDASVWGDREAGSPTPDAAQLAAAVSGGRVRRRR